MDDRTEELLCNDDGQFDDYLPEPITKTRGSQEKDGSYPRVPDYICSFMASTDHAKNREPHHHEVPRPSCSRKDLLSQNGEVNNTSSSSPPGNTQRMNDKRSPVEKTFRDMQTQTKHSARIEMTKCLRHYKKECLYRIVDPVCNYCLQSRECVHCATSRPVLPTRNNLYSWYMY